MYDVAAIDSINADQLVTATDRLLLRGRLPRLQAPAWARKVSELAAGSERTVVTRPCPSTGGLLTRAALVASLFSLTALLVASL